MNPPDQPTRPTEAHREVAVAIFAIAMKSAHHGAPFREPCAQLIADSEARATAELRGALALGQENCDAAYDELRVDCDELRADVVRLTAERDLLRAEVERLKFYIATTIQPDEYAKVIKDLRAEVERSKKSCEFADFQRQQARAEKAEAQLYALRLVCGTTDANKFETWTDRANARAERAEAQLATERARLDWLAVSDTWFDYPATESFNPETFRAAIDAAMKEDSK